MKSLKRFEKKSFYLNTINPEIFVRIFIFASGVQDIFATLKIRDEDMLYLYQ